MRKLIGLIIIILVLGCNTLLQDRDVPPQLSLQYVNQTDDYYLFYFNMVALEDIHSFAVELLFDSELFTLNAEEFFDENGNGHYETDEQFLDCGIDRLCNDCDQYDVSIDCNEEIGLGSCYDSICIDQITCESNANSFCEESGCDNELDCIGTGPEQCGSIWTNNCNSIWDPNDPAGDDYIGDDQDYTRTEGNNKWDDSTVLWNAEFENYPNFYTISETEPGKISFAGALFEYETPSGSLPLSFEEVNFTMALVVLKIKEDIELPSQSMITFGNWQLLKEDGNGAYFGGMVVTDTLFVELN